MKEIMESNRRNFFKVIGIGAFGTLLMNFLPVKLADKISKKRNETSVKPKVTIHPLAVKRNDGMK